MRYLWSMGAAAAILFALSPVTGSAQTRQARASASSAPLPASFRGRIVYRGTYSGSEQAPQRRGQVKLGKMLANAVGLNSTPIGGSSSYTLEFDGNRVTGSFEINDGRRSARGTLTGTRQGTMCRLFDKDGGAFIATCTASEFRGSASSGASSRVKWKTRFQASAVGYTDYAQVQRNRPSPPVSAPARNAATPSRPASGYVQPGSSPPATGPAAKPALVAALRTAVQNDATNWGINRFDSGSLSNVRVIRGSGAAPSRIRGTYTFNNGHPGWVEADVSGGRILCLNYWDTGSRCTPPRAASQYQRRRCHMETRTATGVYAGERYQVEVCE